MRTIGLITIPLLIVLSICEIISFDKKEDKKHIIFYSILLPILIELLICIILT